MNAVPTTEMTNATSLPALGSNQLLLLFFFFFHFQFYFKVLKLQRQQNFPGTNNTCLKGGGGASARFSY
jgi:hypothetical protein